MLILRKTAMALLVLGTNGLFAGTMGPVCNAINVTLPCDRPSWVVAGQALYLQPTLGDISLSNLTYAGPEGSNYYTVFNPAYGWGYKLEGAYQFGTGNDIDINWYHLNSGNNYNFTGNNDILPDTLVLDVVGTASVDPGWNAVNIEFGQHIDFGRLKNIRVHAGAEYARITNDRVIGATGIFPGSAMDDGEPYSVVNSSLYNGFGPRIGADMAYDWGSGFAMYGNGAATLLVGSKGFTSTYVSAIGNNTSSYTGSYTAIVPELEAKLGATYTYRTRYDAFTLDAGWMWVNYFNAQSSQVVLEASTDGTTVNAIYNTKEANFALQGPYVGLKWLGNVL